MWLWDERWWWVLIVAGVFAGPVGAWNAPYVLKSIPSFRAEWNGDPESMPRQVDSRVRGNDGELVGFLLLPSSGERSFPVTTLLTLRTEPHPVIPGGVERRPGIHASADGFPRSRE